MRSKLTRFAWLALAVFSLVAGASRARAQTGGDLDLDSFRPAMDSRGYITVNASQVLANKDISFGLVTDWGHDVLKLSGGPVAGAYDSGNAAYRVTDVISPTLQVAFGIAGFLEIGASVPFRVNSGTWDPNFIGDAADPRDNDQFNFSAQGVGDIGLHLKLRILDTSHFPIGLALVGSVYIPAGYDDKSWLGENQVTPRFSLVIDHEWRRVRMALNGGILLRSDTRTFLDAPRPGASAMAPFTNQTVVAKNELPFGAAIAFALVKDRFDLVGEVTGSIPLDATNYQPLEVLGAIKLYLARNSFFIIGGGAGVAPDNAANPGVRVFAGIVFEPSIGDRDGDGIKDDVDKCPDEPEDRDGFEDADGCPDPDNDRDGIPDELDKCPNEPEDMDGIQDADGCPEKEVADRDGDGIPDSVDKCPDDPEDKDGFQDADGCPDPDNDNDRIPDKLDKCPNEPETYNGFEDADGCPDKGRVIVHQSNIEILDKIYFETDKAIIKPESFPILDAIAATLLGNPDIHLVEIQGHADERGSDEHNLQLTDDRAHSVQKYLTDKGVDASRLVAKGYGETRPIDPRHNQAAWAKNRRVEFVIVQRK